MGKFSTRTAGSIVRKLGKVTRKLVRLDHDKILNALSSFGQNQSEMLLVHSSLSACGYIDGGPETVVKALRSWIPQSTLLAMPTHTWSYPTPLDAAPLFDAQATPSLVGAITDFFWRQPEVVRSLHPSHSLACHGVGADEFCENHELHETPCGAGTPYKVMVETNTSVLMFGATLDSYTLFHTAEDAAQLPYLYLPEKMMLRTKRLDGAVIEVPSWRQNMAIARRFSETVDWLEQENLLQRRKLGKGELLFIPRADRVHDEVVKQLRNDPMFLIASSERERA
ncbi:MAG TPA: AAC(3) family N-acetyltransferase, partial [Pyrinomonadaceae bacterium]|nr:AAC(3) family N-acetyltransferase [Pyrinomonadaceae bacterium]